MSMGKETNIDRLIAFLNDTLDTFVYIGGWLLWLRTIEFHFFYPSLVGFDNSSERQYDLSLNHYHELSSSTKWGNSNCSQGSCKHNKLSFCHTVDEQLEARKEMTTNGQPKASTFRPEQFGSSPQRRYSSCTISFFCLAGEARFLVTFLWMKKLWNQWW